ncbi:hypothetical protein NQ318_020287 [Aromia moschata]|uniref:Uncharacterized protein n=1 Tax=Aromia moschata TaxID=1265417 RepID=A0AAV8ZB17_9CUCU|nr:hypothetical protein NQ318_020287 [Aromia moschata]
MLCKLSNETDNIAPDLATLRRRELEGRNALTKRRKKRRGTPEPGAPSMTYITLSTRAATNICPMSSGGFTSGPFLQQTPQ